MTPFTHSRVVLISTMLLAAPIVSHASDAATNACVTAFVSSSIEKDRPYTVKTKEPTASRYQAARTYRVSLEAKGKQSGKTLAQAECVVDRSGVVLTLNGKPYEASAAVLSAR